MTASEVITLAASLFLLLSSPIRSFASDTFSATDARKRRFEAVLISGLL
jgi:hypothetical protein